jgi:hypothetical protein
MHSDAFFRRGATHDVCQDYALAGEVNGRAFGIVSDGCSSSEHTDFGARFLAFGAREALRQSPASRFCAEAVLPLACASVGKMVPMGCLDATLGLVYADECRFRVWLSGDGVVVARRRDGEYWVLQVEFSGNAPGYLSYLLDGRRFHALTQEHGPGGIRQVLSATLSQAFKETATAQWKAEPLTPSPQSFWLDLPCPTDLYDLVMVLSDGALSFQRKADSGHLEAVPLNEVLSHVLAFKGMSGRFVARRCKRFLERYCQEHGWSHGDDFGVAAVYAGG